MHQLVRAAFSAVLLSGALASTSAVAAPTVTTTFTGPWAPTLANGFEAVAPGSATSTFTTSVSADGKVLTAHIANNGDVSHPSFFLQNYAFLTSPVLPTGRVKYDYTIELLSPTGGVFEFDDFGRGGAFHAAGTLLSGTVDFLYTGGYFGYFGINIGDGAGTASAIVTLSNFSAPLPEPQSFALAGLALAALGVSRAGALRRTRANRGRQPS